MVAAGIHAAGDVEFQFADVVLVVEILEALLDRSSEGQRAGIGQAAEIAAGAGDQILQQADGRRGEASGLGAVPDGVELALRHVGEDQVLFVGDANLAEAVAFCQFGGSFHLFAAAVARGGPGFFQRQRNRSVAGDLVRLYVALDPAREGPVLAQVAEMAEVVRCQGFILRRGELRRDASDFGSGQRRRTILQVRPFCVDLSGELFAPECLDQDLDTRLVSIVAAAVAVEDAYQRLGVGQQVLPGQKLAHYLTEQRGAAEAAAGIDREADFACRAPHDLQAEVMHLNRRAVFSGAGDRDLEFARQVSELGVKGRPLAQDLGPGTRVGNLVCGDAGEVIGGHIANAVARGLDGMQFVPCQFGEDVRNVGQLDPVQLQVMTRGEVAEAAVVEPRDVGEAAQLFRREQAVGHGEAQHRAVALNVEAVLQA